MQKPAFTAHPKQASSCTKPRAAERGGTFLGLVLGILIGLFAALAVAVYVTKVPIPFGRHGDTTEGSIQDDLQKNKDWNPNTSLNGKNATIADTVQIPTRPAAASAAQEESAAPKNKTAHTEIANATATPKPKASNSDDPLADLVKSKTVVKTDNASSASAADPFIYYVQIGAYIDTAQAESQKAQAALAGFDASISAKEQAGRQMYRVRLGPFDTKDAADKAKARVEGSGMDGSLVRIPR